MPPIHWDTIITGLVSAALFWGIRRLTSMLKAYIDHSAEWREKTDTRLEKLEEKVETTVSGQCTQLRGDIIHKSHRYLDDLGMASTEEKGAFYAEYEEYQKLCDENDIVNHFIDTLVERVMALPEREI